MPTPNEPKGGPIKQENSDNKTNVKAPDALKAEAQMSSEESDDDLFGKPGGADTKTKDEGNPRDQ